MGQIWPFFSAPLYTASASVGSSVTVAASPAPESNPFRSAYASRTADALARSYPSSPNGNADRERSSSSNDANTSRELAGGLKNSAIRSGGGFESFIFRAAATAPAPTRYSSPADFFFASASASASASLAVAWRACASTAAWDASTPVMRISRVRGSSFARIQPSAAFALIRVAIFLCVDRRTSGRGDPAGREGATWRDQNALESIGSDEGATDPDLSAWRIDASISASISEGDSADAEAEDDDAAPAAAAPAAAPSAEPSSSESSSSESSSGSAPLASSSSLSTSSSSRSVASRPRWSPIEIETTPVSVNPSLGASGGAAGCAAARAHIASPWTVTRERNFPRPSPLRSTSPADISAAPIANGAGLPRRATANSAPRSCGGVRVGIRRTPGSMRSAPRAITIAATSGWRTTTGSPRSVGTRHSAKTVGAWSPLPVGSYAMGWPSLT